MSTEPQTPDLFTLVCLTLADEAVKNQEPLHAGPCTNALREALTNVLLNGPIDQRPKSVTEADRRARWEASRLIDWARAHQPDPVLLVPADQYPTVAP